MNQQVKRTPFPQGKLLDFFRHFDPTRPQHVEGVRRLERSLRDSAPDLLTDEAFWVSGWRTATKPPAPLKPKTFSVGSQDKIKLQSQHNSVSCGQTSCAMAINALTGKDLDDFGFNARHGFELLEGLRAECPHWEWWDQGNIGPDNWDDLEACLRAGGLAIAAGNGPLFSASGRGHIVCVYKLTDQLVAFADPNGGLFRSVTRKEWEGAVQHPQGNFLFLSKPR